MARPLRIDYPDTFYHVLSRGNEQKLIYYDTDDYERQSWDLCIYIMSRMGAYTNREIGEVFGFGYTAITGTVKRTEQHLARNTQLQRLIEQIVDELQ